MKHTTAAERLTAAKAIGFGWYTATDYPEILRIMHDGQLLPASYGDWLTKAMQHERDLTNSGLRVIRVIIQPKQFSTWRAIHQCQIDAKARMAYAAEQAAIQLGHLRSDH